jgi:hypothetical protein
VLLGLRLFPLGLARRSLVDVGSEWPQRNQCGLDDGFNVKVREFGVFDARQVMRASIRLTGVGGTRQKA